MATKPPKPKPPRMGDFGFRFAIGDLVCLRASNYLDPTFAPRLVVTQRMAIEAPAIGVSLMYCGRFGFAGSVTTETWYHETELMKATD